MPSDHIERAMAVALGDAVSEQAALPRLKVGDLQHAVAELREHGVARAEGRPIPGVNAFSAPAYDHEGQAVIVITALDHQDRFPADWDSAAAQSVRDAAREISSRLGWRPEAPDAGGTKRG